MIRNYIIFRGLLEIQRCTSIECVFYIGFERFLVGDLVSRPIATVSSQKLSYFITKDEPIKLHRSCIACIHLFFVVVRDFFHISCRDLISM